MNELKIALLQLTAHGNDLAANQAKGEAACRQAKARGADIALFPEMWSAGYTPLTEFHIQAPEFYRSSRLWGPNVGLPYRPQPSPEEVWGDLPVERDGPFVRHFQALARELDMAIALTYLERWEGAPRNCVSLIDRHGEILFTYAKVHTCAWSLDEGATTAGDDFYVATLDTAAGDVTVGAMICYDREHPESARILMLKGAEIILTPNACELEPNRLGQFRVRAMENVVGVAMANYAEPFGGHSVAYDPIAYNKNGGSRDQLVVEAGRSEGVYLACFDLDAIRDCREREIWGNAFRRPRSYRALTELNVAGPFVRIDADGRVFDGRTIATGGATRADETSKNGYHVDDGVPVGDLPPHPAAHKRG